MRIDNVYTVPTLALASAVVDDSISQKHYLQLTEASLAGQEYDPHSHEDQQKLFSLGHFAAFLLYFQVGKAAFECIYLWVMGGKAKSNTTN